MGKGRTFTVTFSHNGEEHSIEVKDTDKPGAKSIAQRKIATSLKVPIKELVLVSITEDTQNQ